MSPLDELARANGFDDENDLMRCIARADLTTPDKLAAFLKWKNDDGSKSALLQLPRHEPQS